MAHETDDDQTRSSGQPRNTMPAPDVTQPAKPQGHSVSAAIIDVPPWDRQRDRRTLVLLLMVVWITYLATATYDSVQINDNRAVNLSAWSVGVRGTFELPSEWEGGNRWIVEGRDGALYTNRFPGAILWAAPFHAVAEPFFGFGTPGHDALLNYAPGGVAAATAAALAIGVSFLVLRRLAARRLAVTASLFLAYGSGVWSVSADSMWTHGVTHLTLMLGVLAVSEARHARSGLFFAAAVLARPHTAVVPAVVGVWETAVRRRWRPMLVVGTTSVLGVVLLAIYSQWLFETWVPVAGYDTNRPGGVVSTSWLVTAERVGFTLAHPLRGVLIFTPALLVLLPFIRHGWRASPSWVRSAAVGGLLYLAVQMRVNDWTGGGDYFGSRLTLETLVLLTPLLLRTWQACVARSERLKGACVGLLVVGVLVHAYGAFNPIWTESREAWLAEVEELCEREPELNGC